ncbi:SAM-dependent methyltransferase [Spirochaeta dissipatitropha]
MSLIQPLIATAEKLLVQFPWAIRFYTGQYRDIVSRELEAANVSPGDTLLQIGCGSIPFTAIYLAELSDTNIVAIDNDASAVQRARKLVASLGLENRISIVHCDGTEIDGSGCSAVFIALQARPKSVILENLRRTCPAGTRFIFRSPAERFQTQYDSIPGIVALSPWVEHDMPTFKRSYVHVAS